MVRANAILLAAATLAACALVALGVSLAWGANDRRELAEVVKQNCEAIEALKAQFREQALQNFERLEENARLLDIPLTEELRQAAEQGRDRTLRRFAESDC